VRDIPPSSPLQPLLIWGMVNVGLARPWGAAVWGSYYKSLYPTAAPPDMSAHLQQLRTNLAEPGRLTAVQAMFRASKSDIEARLDTVRAPTLVVMGSRDPDFPQPAAEARAIAERLNGSVCMVDGAGHYPYAEMPEQAVPRLLTFLSAGQA
jgi:pimeloyl-ACP methyl ester carboxylesterase